MSILSSFGEDKSYCGDYAFYRALLNNPVRLRLGGKASPTPWLWLILVIVLSPVLGWTQCAITTTSLPSAVIGHQYFAVVYTTGCVGNLVWQAIGVGPGSGLPKGLQVTSGAQETGIISGTPTAIGATTFTLRAIGVGPIDTALRPFFIAVFPQQDIYGGLTLPIHGCKPGYFQVLDVSGRWLMADPLCNVFYLRGVQNVTYAQIYDNYPGGAQLLTNRYPDGKGGFDGNAWFLHTAQRLQSYGFNTISEYANAGMFPGNPYLPIKMPYIVLLNAASLSENYPDRCNSARPITSVTDSLASNIDSLLVYAPAKSNLDVFDPMWQACAISSYQTSRTGGASDPYLIGYTSENMDSFFALRASVQPYPHLGFLAALSNFCSPNGSTANSDCAGLPNTPNKNFTKYAWANYLKTKYNGNIVALNAAWGTGGHYTSFGTVDGWGQGAERGILDEDGCINDPGTGCFGGHSWLGGTNMDVYQMSGASTAFQADVNAFLALYSQALVAADVYAVRDRSQGNDPNHLIMSSVAMGGKDGNDNLCASAPRAPVVTGQKAGGVEVMIGCYNPTPASDSPAVDRFLYDVSGEPVYVWYTATANADSDWHQLWCDTNGNYYGPGGTNYCQSNQTDYPLQTTRGAQYATDATTIFNIQGTDGSYPVLGVDWWEWTEKVPEHSNFGLISDSDNAYDGNCATVAGGVDAFGVPCGGEPANYGNFLWHVTAANVSILQSLLGQ